ncbi:MAG: nucleotidyltransferase domain-containing protein [Pyrinomonadaceae bacterium]
MIYEDVLARLAGDGVRYVVTGGVAVLLHGFERETRDLDIVVDASPAEAGRATRSLASAGFFATIPLPPHLLVVLTMTDAAGRSIDVFMRYPVPFEELWANSELVRVGDCLARVSSFADVVRAKQLQGLPHHLRDAEELLAQAARRARDKSDTG